MKDQILLNAEELKEVKEELINLYELTHHEKPSNRWLTNSIKAMLVTLTGDKKKQFVN